MKKLNIRDIIDAKLQEKRVKMYLGEIRVRDALDVLEKELDGFWLISPDGPDELQKAIDEDLSGGTPFH